MTDDNGDAVTAVAATAMLAGEQDLITSLALKRAMEVDEDAFFSRKKSSLQFRDVDKKTKKKKKSKKVTDGDTAALADRKQRKKKEVVQYDQMRGRSRSRSRNSSRSRSSSPVVILDSARNKKDIRKPTLSPPPALSREQLEAAKNALLSSDVFGSTRSVIDIFDDDSDDDVVTRRNDGDGDDGNENADDANADLLPELAAKIRERMRAMTAQKSVVPDYTSNMPAPRESQFIVHVLVETQISLDQASDEEDLDEPRRIKSRVFKVKSTYTFSKIRYAWMKACKIPEDVMESIVFLDNSSYSRLYDESTPLMVGVTEEDPHLSILAVRKNEVDKLRQDLLERFEHMDDDDDVSNKTDEDEAQEIPSSQPAPSNEIKLYLQDGKGERIHLKVKPESKISTIIKYYRTKRNIAPNMQVTLEMDDELIPENATVSETEIEDEVTIDVHVR
ncbi:ubiquitin-2 like Rad60 SUMO-like-domain-containing protein [Lipomyces tetrasporus]|uniref:Ubiquitin-2 like Rad60 SUMO-like-domain-containing protein n=1 Tax=Lipomyces tetrasporus TaxID=54092 RepID=A0AAD7QUB6_9ASCO|nr:ubiquitin-2 like Rad60 SUMO-like-domain-containing protein [Lipomyces tetrasporus]KAJ8101584.1 ubiquitin-2 like Rad60 SUMO-like-domain-containing protein [Lipomyces tetrasporus]